MSAETAAPPTTTDARLDALLERLGELIAIAARPRLDDKLAVSLDEAALLVSTSAKTLKRMVSEGTLPGVLRVRRRLLVSVAALKEWIARGCPDQLTAGRSKRRA